MFGHPGRSGPSSVCCSCWNLLHGAHPAAHQHGHACLNLPSRQLPAACACRAVPCRGVPWNVFSGRHLRDRCHHMYVRSPPGADQGPAQRKHAPISWHEWQGPWEHDAAAGSRAERATRENGPERRRRRASADGGKHSDRDGREQRSSRHSPVKSRGVESSRAWRERILREAAAERGAAAETGARRSSREGSEGRSERQQEPRSEDRHRLDQTPRRGRSSKSQSLDADPEGPANTGDRREDVMNPRIGPAGPRELEETEEEAQLRR